MKNCPHSLLLIFLTFFLTFNIKSQHLNLRELENKIESLIPEVVNDSTPGLVIGIVHNGTLLFSKGYGMANLSYGLPNKPEMVYNLGSVSKQFLGYAFAMLHEEGTLNVDDSVGSYLEDWPTFDQKVTIRHLLTHTSGYREAYAMSNLAGRVTGIDRLTKKECLDVVRRQPTLEFIPGSRYVYNSTAWVILAEILERVTGQPAHQWVKERVLIPLGMRNTHIETYVGEVIPNAAESYSYNPTLGYSNSKSNRAIFGAADVYASVEDLAHWLTHFQTQKIGDPSVMDLFLSPYQLNDGTFLGYGFGIENGTHKGLRVYSHTGSHESFLTQLRYYPAYGLGIVTISNFDKDGWLDTKQIAEYVLRGQMKFSKRLADRSFKISSDGLEKFEGPYLSPFRNKIIHLSLMNDTLTTSEGTKIIPKSKNKFYSKTTSRQFDIIERKNQPLQLVIDGDSKVSYQKVNQWTPMPTQLKKYESNYVSRELETTYHLTVKEGSLVIQHRWLGQIDLKPVTRDLFQSDRGWLVEFKRSKTNEILGFNINTHHTLNVFFEKKKEMKSL